MTSSSLYDAYKLVTANLKSQGVDTSRIDKQLNLYTDLVFNFNTGNGKFNVGDLGAEYKQKLFNKSENDILSPIITYYSNNINDGKNVNDSSQLQLDAANKQILGLERSLESARTRASSTSTTSTAVLAKCTTDLAAEKAVSAQCTADLAAEHAKVADLTAKNTTINATLLAANSMSTNNGTNNNINTVKTAVDTAVAAEKQRADVALVAEKQRADVAEAKAKKAADDLVAEKQRADVAEAKAKKAATDLAAEKQRAAVAVAALEAATNGTSIPSVSSRSNTESKDQNNDNEYLNTTVRSITTKVEDLYSKVATYKSSIDTMNIANLDLITKFTTYIKSFNKASSINNKKLQEIVRQTTLVDNMVSRVLTNNKQRIAEIINDIGEMKQTLNPNITPNPPTASGGTVLATIISNKPVVAFLAILVAIVVLIIVLVAVYDKPKIEPLPIGPFVDNYQDSYINNNAYHSP
jgi:hypothetical protein